MKLERATRAGWRQRIGRRDATALVRVDVPGSRRAPDASPRVASTWLPGFPVMAVACPSAATGGSVRAKDPLITEPAEEFAMSIRSRIGLAVVAPVVVIACSSNSSDTGSFAGGAGGSSGSAPGSGATGSSGATSGGSSGGSSAGASSSGGSSGSGMSSSSSGGSTGSSSGNASDAGISRDGGNAREGGADASPPTDAGPVQTVGVDGGSGTCGGGAAQSSDVTVNLSSLQQRIRGFGN